MIENWSILGVTIKNSIRENTLSIQYCAFLLICSFFITALIMISSFFEDDNVILNISMTVYYLMMFILIFAVVRTVFSFSGEIENKTLEVMLSLPIKRSTLFIGKISGLTISMIPLIIIPMFFYFGILGIITGAIPNILTLMTLQLTLLAILTTCAVIIVTAAFSLIFKKTTMALIISILYVLVMIIITPSINNFGNQKIIYDVDYFNIFLLPYSILGAGISSMRANGGVDSNLMIIETLFCTYTGIIGYFAMKRLEL